MLVRSPPRLRLSAVYLVVNLLVDLSYLALDPRIRY